MSGVLFMLLYNAITGKSYCTKMLTFGGPAICLYLFAISIGGFQEYPTSAAIAFVFLNVAAAYVLILSTILLQSIGFVEKVEDENGNEITDENT